MKAIAKHKRTCPNYALESRPGVTRFVGSMFLWGIIHIERFLDGVLISTMKTEMSPNARMRRSVSVTNEEYIKLRRAWPFWNEITGPSGALTLYGRCSRNNFNSALVSVYTNNYLRMQWFNGVFLFWILLSKGVKFVAYFKWFNPERTRYSWSVFQIFNLMNCSRLG